MIHVSVCRQRRSAACEDQQQVAFAAVKGIYTNINEVLHLSVILLHFTVLLTWVHGIMRSETWQCLMEGESWWTVDVEVQGGEVQR